MTQDKKIGSNDENEISKEERIQTYVKSLHAIEEAMEPFKEQKRSLKGNYVWMAQQG